MEICKNWTLTFEDPATGSVQTIPAKVPGNVIGDLQRAGIIPDPYFGSNSLALRKYEFADWTYKTTFVPPVCAPGERLQLTLDGVDTVFTLRINGREAGRGENMFIAHNFDVTDFVKPGEENELTVDIESSINFARNIPLTVASHTHDYSYDNFALRRALHTYGWDIAPRIIGAGLWRKVTLEVIKPERWTEVYLHTDEIENGQAELTLFWQFTSPRKMLDGYTAKFTMKCGDSELEVTKTLRFTAGVHRITLPSPKLWEPRNWGTPHLYDCTLTLFHDGEEKDVYTFRTGVRTINLLRSEPEPHVRGKFLFEVNGRPFFAMGSNWVPTDALHGENPERVRNALLLMAETGSNMIRCWGGSVYEDHDFFDLCDELGFLVWQDFMLACLTPLQDERYRKAMAEEAASVIRKLRQHPSIALWSGDNECDASLYWTPRLHKLLPSSNSITREILPRAVWTHDPGRDYLPSSPYLHDKVAGDPETYHCPEQHLWGPRDDFKRDFYRLNTAVFASEMGYHGMPEPASVKQFLPQESWNARVGNPDWICHAAQPFGDTDGVNVYRVQLMIDQVLALFGTVPEELEPFAELSQIVQAEAFKFFIESFRIRWPEKTGVLWWNLIDCWPQFSDAVVDYYYRKKLAFNYIRLSQQPVALMFDEPKNWHIDLYVSNVTLEAQELDYQVEDLDSGEVVLSGHCRAEANSSCKINALRMSSGEQKMYLITWQGPGVSGKNHYLQGSAPFAPDQYKVWLEKLKNLPEYQ